MQGVGDGNGEAGSAFCPDWLTRLPDGSEPVAGVDVPRSAFDRRTPACCSIVSAASAASGAAASAAAGSAAALHLLPGRSGPEGLSALARDAHRRRAGRAVP